MDTQAYKGRKGLALRRGGQLNDDNQIRKAR